MFETRMNAVGANSTDAQEPFEFDFWHWLGLKRRERKAKKSSNIEAMNYNF